MKKRTTIITILLVLCVGFMGGYCYISPYTTLANIKKAAENEDYIYMREHIDFPTVKESLKEQLTVIFTEEISNDPTMKDNPFAGLAVVLGGAMVSKAVDHFLSPAMISRMVDSDTDEVSWAEIVQSSHVGYRDFSTFVITVEGENAYSHDEENAVLFIMKREGLFTWMVKDIVLVR